MSNFVELKSAQDVVKFEINLNYCREAGLIEMWESSSSSLYDGEDDSANENALQPGLILQKDGAKWIPCVDGSSAAGILISVATEADLLTNDVSAVILSRGPAIVDADRLFIDDDNELVDALVALDALGIKLADEPTQYNEGTPLAD
jgi:hypothetical protein